MNSARIVELIVTELTGSGKGVEGDPFRIVTQYWQKDGTLLFEIDPCEPSIASLLDLIRGVVAKCEADGYVGKDGQYLKVLREALATYTD